MAAVLASGVVYVIVLHPVRRPQHLTLDPPFPAQIHAQRDSYDFTVGIHHPDVAVSVVARSVGDLGAVWRPVGSGVPVDVVAGQVGE